MAAETTKTKKSDEKEMAKGAAAEEGVKTAVSAARDHAQLRQAQAEAAKLGAKKAKEEMKADNKKKKSVSEEKASEIIEDKAQGAPESTEDVKPENAGEEKKNSGSRVVHVTEELPVYLL